MLGDFFSQGIAQLNLFDDNAPRKNSAALMEVLDHINHKNGRGALLCRAGYSAAVADETGNAVTAVYNTTV